MVHKVLLADDSPNIHKLVAMALSDSDFQLVAVSDGEQAIEHLDKFTPDIILADAIMPKMDGYQVCEYVRSTPRFAHIPLIILVSRFQPYDKERDEKTGVSRMMFKPFSSDQLMKQMDQLLAEAAAAAPPPAPAPAVPAGFDEGATVAIRPEDLRAHLQQLDHITSSQDEEMPSIEDFALADDGFVDDEPEAVVGSEAFSEDATVHHIMDEPLELHTEDLDDLELDDEEPAADFDDAATLVAESFAQDSVDMVDDSLEDLNLEDSAPDLEPAGLDDFALEDEEGQLPSAQFADFDDEDTAPASAAAVEESDELALEDSAETEELSGELEFVEDSLDELGLDDVVPDLEDEPLADLEAEEPRQLADDDTQPVDMSSYNTELPEFEDSALEDSAELELEFDDDIEFDTAPSADEDVLGLNRPDSGEFEAVVPSEAVTSSQETPTVDYPYDEMDTTVHVDEPLADALSDSFGSSDEDEALMSDDFVGEEDFAAGDSEADAHFESNEDSLFNDQDADIFAEGEENPPPTEETERFTIEDDEPFSVDSMEDLHEDEDDIALDEVDLEESVALSEDIDLMDDQSLPNLGELGTENSEHDAFENAQDFSLSEEEDSGEESVVQDTHSPFESSGLETIRVEEPVIQPEEAAYFADTIRSDQPLAAPPTATLTLLNESEPSAAGVAPMAALDDEQISRIADLVVQRLVEKLGTGEVRDIVWQVVPELAEAMIKKRIYQLEQSVDAE